MRRLRLPAAIGPVLLAGALAVGMPSPTRAQWAPPAACTAGITGNEFGDPPVVEYYADGKLTTDTVDNVTWDSKGRGFARVYVVPSTQTLKLLYVTFTPFLIGYLAFDTSSSSPGYVSVPIPPAGYSQNKQTKLFDSFTVTIHAPGSSTPMANASVMWTPYFTGSDPYVTQTDANGQMVIDCYQSLPGGNAIYVVSADGKTEFEAVVTPDGSDSTSLGAAHAASGSGSNR